MSYAGFWKRFAAYIIDAIVLSIATVGLAMVFGVSLLSDDPAAAMSGAMGVQVANIVITWLYFAYFESSERQATPGKMALGIQVTDANGSRLSFGRATGRFFGKIVSGIILMIGFIMAAFTQQKQALHDIIAGTLVVNKDSVMA